MGGGKPFSLTFSLSNLSFLLTQCLSLVHAFPALFGPPRPQTGILLQSLSLGIQCFFGEAVFHNSMPFIGPVSSLSPLHTVQMPEVTFHCLEEQTEEDFSGVTVVDIPDRPIHILHLLIIPKKGRDRRKEEEGKRKTQTFEA